MLSRSFAGAVCAAALIAASSSIAAPTARSPQPTYSSGGGFFANFFAMLNHVPRIVVSFPTNQRPGTVIVRTNERRLYLVLGNGQALRYGIGVGREGFTWSGVATVTAKREWPDWTPPEEMLRRKPELPRHMAGGPDNPLGARALYLGESLYRIHGSNEPWTIGTAATSGCIRLTNDDVIDLYSRVPLGATVIVQR